MLGLASSRVGEGAMSSPPISRSPLNSKLGSSSSLLLFRPTIRPAASIAADARTMPAIPPDERVVVEVSSVPPMARSVELGAEEGRAVNDGEEVIAVGCCDDDVGGRIAPEEGDVLEAGDSVCSM